ncbi:MAG TPA: hypothetical protein VGC84_02815, partial [Ilumatobacteraceae bacterium]
MRVRVTIPTEARHIVPDQRIAVDGTTWLVDEVRRRRDDVTFTCSPPRRSEDGRSIITVPTDVLVHCLPAEYMRAVLESAIMAAVRNRRCPFAPASLTTASR